jgi:membrane-bound lytic murein transglycosylase B
MVVVTLGGALPAAAEQRGWGYLIDKLVVDGIERERVERTFADPHLPAFDGLQFASERRQESPQRYRRFLKSFSATAARRCRASLRAAFDSAERVEGVPASVLAAIMFVETGCGQNVGAHRIFHRLARLAMANDPDNLSRNLQRVAMEQRGIDASTATRMKERALYLEQTFYPEVRAIFEVADRLGVAPLDLRGSISGAFGYPQFLPTSYLRHGVDADGNGAVSLFDPADAAASCARYLAHYGWRPGITKAQRRQVIWSYNRSNAYVDTVLTLAARIEQGAAAARGSKQPAARQRSLQVARKQRRR